MNQVRIPFEKIGVEPADGHLVVSAIKAFLDQHPVRSVPITEISQFSGVPGPIVKRILFALLALTHLKASFRPRHRECDHIVGHAEESVRRVKELALEGQYWCVDCGTPIDGPEDIEIEILFKKPGADDI